MTVVSWAKAILGLFLTWVTFVVTSVFYGVVLAIRDIVISEVNNTGLLVFPQEINSAIDNLTGQYEVGLKLLMFLVIVGFSAYIIINSIRRKIDEEVNLY